MNRELWKSKTWITKQAFDDLEINNKIYIRYMYGDAYVFSKPFRKSMGIIKSEMQVYNTIIVHFKSGPWKNKKLNIIRQQIAKID